MSWTNLIEPAPRTVEFENFELERTADLDFSNPANFGVGQVWLNELHELLNSKNLAQRTCKLDFLTRDLRVGQI